jgi:hypothetical protein
MQCFSHSWIFIRFGSRDGATGATILFFNSDRIAVASPQWETGLSSISQIWLNNFNLMKTSVFGDKPRRLLKSLQSFGTHCSCHGNLRTRNFNSVHPLLIHIFTTLSVPYVNYSDEIQPKEVKNPSVTSVQRLWPEKDESEEQWKKKSITRSFIL